MRNKIIHFLLIAFVISACHDGVDIARNGKSDYTIILSADASHNDTTAALYLNKYIREMSGADIPIVSDTSAIRPFEICIGKTNRQDFSDEELAEDAFLIKTMGNKIFIAGGDRKGSIYGVITLLEHWGCRRFSPEEAFIPKLSYIPMDSILIKDAPANSLRVINGSMTEYAEYADWLRISTISEISPPGYYVHTFHTLIPKEEYFDDHPEYFAWLNNKYSFDQPCPSNPEVKALIIEKLESEMKKEPGFHTWAVSQNDNFTYCRCDKCMAIIEEEGSPAGPIIRLVNEVAAAFPNKEISTLAYQFSRPAPEKVKPAENVLVRLCTIELNRSRPIETDSMSQSFVTDIIDWGKIGHNIYLWDYTINFNHSVSPFPNLHVLQPNLQFFYENNVRKQFPQSNLQKGHEFAELKGKMLSALMWDPYVNIDSVQRDFIEHFYGPASPLIKKYIDQMEAELIRSGKILYIYEPPNNHSEDYLSAENVVLYNQWFDEAEALVENDNILLNRILLARLPLQYAMLEIGKNDMFGPRGWYDETENGFVIRQNMKETLESFYTVCQSNDITTLNERSLTPETYYRSTLRFIDVQVEGNKAFRKQVSASPAPAKKYANGNTAILTDGVQGAHDFAVHWLGWWGEDADILVDLGEKTNAEKIEIGTLWDGRSWILHPSSISCMVSKDDLWWIKLGTKDINGDQQEEETTRKYIFNPGDKEFRYVRFKITGAGPLPKWHASEGEPSWFFVDEIAVY